MLINAGIIEAADATPTQGWFRPFSVVEEKATGMRGRFIAWTEDKNANDVYEPDVPLTHISNHLKDVHEEAAGLIDLKASFFQLPLPPMRRSLFRCRTLEGKLVQLTRLPMGYRVSLELLHTITRVIAGDREVVRPQFACDAALSITVWIDNVRGSWWTRTSLGVVYQHSAHGSFCWCDNRRKHGFRGCVRFRWE